MFAGDNTQMSKIIKTKYIKLFQTVCEAPIKAPKEAFNSKKTPS